MPEDVSVDFTAKGSGEILKVLQQIEKLLQSIDKSSAAMAAALNKAAAASKVMTNAANQNAKATANAQKAQQGMVQSLDAVIAASEAYQESLKAQYPTLDAVIKRMSELKAQLAIIKRDGMEQSGVTQEQVNAMRAEVSALNQVAGSMRRTASETKKAETAQKKLTNQASKLVKQFFLAGVGARTVMAAVLAMRTATLKAIDAVYGQTDAYQALEKSAEGLSYTFVAVIGNLIDAERGMGSLTGVANTASQVLMLAGAGLVSFFAQVDTTIRALRGEYEGLFESAKEFERFALDKAKAAGMEYLEGVLKDVETGFENTSDAADKFASTLDKLRSAQKRYDDELDRHNKVMADIATKYGNIGTPAGTMRGREGALGTSLGAHTLGTEQIAAYERQRTTRMQIEYDLGKELEKIQSEYNKRRQKIVDDGMRQEKRALQDANRDLKRMKEQHNLEMLQAQRRYDLTVVQNERLYQFERGRLVAEGDVIAIQELDARHELEKQAAEENFKLQQQQAEEMFKLQLKYQKQAAAEMARAIRDSMQEQLRALEENRREEEAEARAAAEEDLMQNDIDFQREMEQLSKQKEELLAAEKETHQENLDELAEYWGEYLAENQIGLDEGLALWNNAMGLNGEMDTLIKGAYARELQFTITFATEWERQNLAITASTRKMVTEVTALLAQLAIAQATVNSLSNVGGGRRGNANTPAMFGGGRRGNANVPFFKYGGDFIASKPQMIGVGDVPERVSVRPLSPIGVGGAVGLSWQGGAIPVEGRGEFSGANLQQLGDSIAAGLVQSLSASFSRRHGVRGR